MKEVLPRGSSCTPTEVCAPCREDGVAERHLEEVGGGEDARTEKIVGSQTVVCPASCPLPCSCATSATVHSIAFRDSPSCFLFLKFSLILSSNIHKRTGCFLCAIRISF